MNPHEAGPDRFFTQSRKPVIGMVHLLPLPGSEDYRGAGVSQILEQALAEAHSLAAGGVDAIMIQNTGDLPPAPDGEPETIAYMSAIGAALRREVACPIGVNVLANGAVAALAIAHAIGAAFVRIKVYVGAVVTTEGVLTGAARRALEFRRKVGAEQIAIAADIYDRTSAPIGDLPLEVAADLALRHGHADALIVSGYTIEDTLAHIRAIKAAIPRAIVLAGGGTTVANVGEFLKYCDGVIVGSGIKNTGAFVGTVDPARLSAYMQAVAAARGGQ